MVTSLLRKEDSADKAKRMNIVKEAVEKCKAIIQKLLVYSRAPVETEQGLTFSRFVRSETDLNKVIENTVELLRESFAQDEIAIETDLSPLPSFRANSTQWSHVFNNLLVNARDALRNAGVARPTIKIHSSCQDDMMRVEVSDNGPGIPKDIRARIFEPFFTTKDVGHGTGLGLAICKEVVRKHQGNVTIGESDEGGAKFTIELKAPVAEEART
ncbi:MAG: HAMP domain-containing histidine kinase [Candidatus Eremiobacteraeota bacterium]|nr:HAMP domain-containing histidine kinase [Candidatus Eremiobacteraeota bacterium]